MRLIERLPLPLSPEYHLGLTESELKITASIFLAYLENGLEPLSPETTIAALTLADILSQVEGDDYRWFKKASKNIRKRCSKK